MHTALLKQLAGGFASNRIMAAKAIRQFQEQYPDAFVSAALEILKDADDTPGSRFLLSTLTARADHLSLFCDPQLFTISQSVRLIHQVKALDALVGVKLARLVSANTSAEGGRADVAIRALDVLDQTGEVGFVLPVLRGLMHCKNADVRTKAALLIGHETRNPQWADMADCYDERVKASAVESLWGLTTPAAKDAFRRATYDPRHRVAGAGVVALYMAGDPESMSATFDFAHSADPYFRAMAAWAMGKMANPRFLLALGPLMKDADPAPRKLALKSLVAIRTKVKEARTIGVVPIRIYKVIRAGGEHTIHLEVGHENMPVAGLDFRNFVVWHGHELVETFSSEQHANVKGGQYRLSFEAECDTRRQVRVELYSDHGAGSAERPEAASNDEIAAANEAIAAEHSAGSHTA